ncbi:hypothetical protein DBR11_04185 [Pedobacter sp. HMWF019]|uniref:hypothetical protein n=1 Tax=Pedobacter sp. HMWF019 TaxID=2056856 RepID=UPI000D3595CF|nr:hypothetical protein [Pedobacter sp. HMWF019]PTT02686.1 hypothetical protein DBR11_04185 [Pedobacter sp. HMWF019]
MSKQALRPCINLYVQLLDILADSSIDIPASMRIRVEKAYQSLSSFLFEMILSQKGDLEHKRTVLKKFVVLLLSRSSGILKKYGIDPCHPDATLNLRQSILMEIRAGLLRIFHLIIYQGLEDIFLELNLVYRTILKRSL